MTHRMWVSMDWFCWENLNRKPVVFNVFTIKYRGFRLKFSHHPILWEWDFDHQLLTKTARWRKIEVTYSESLQSPLKKHMAGGKKNRPNSVLSQWIIHRYPEQQMFGPPNQISLLFWGYGFLFDLFGYHIREYHYESAICVSSSGFLRMDFLHQDHLPGLWIGRICEECHAPASHRHSGTTTPLKNAKRNSSISL